MSTLNDSRPAPRPSQAALIAAYIYDQEAGQFVSRRTGRLVGSVATRNKAKKYLELRPTGCRVLCHLAAWCYVFGDYPVGLQVDHIDGDEQNNRIANLRLVPVAQNAQNRRKASRNSKVGLLGVSRVASGKFVSQISVSGTTHRLGQFLTPEAAHEAYVQAKRRLHPGCTL